MQFFQEFSDGIDHAEGEMGCSSDRDSKARESASVHVGYDEPGVDGLGPSEPEVAESLEFAFDSHRFKISERRWRGPNDEIHAEFSFFEDGTKSFAIRCLVSVDAQGVRYEGCEVATFDTRVNWAKALLGFHANALFERDRASADFRHLRADGIGHGPG